MMSGSSRLDKRRPWPAICVSALCLLFAPLSSADEGPLTAARRLAATGNYAEAREAFERAAGDSPVDAALGLAETLRETGRSNDALATLRAAAKNSDDLRLRVAEAELLFAQGKRDEADRLLTPPALDLPRGRLLKGELLRTSGRLDEAQTCYRWLIEHYNSRTEHSPDDLLAIGRAAAIYAEWNRAHDQFTFLVSDLYPDILRLDPTCWRAHWELGRLYLAKFNQAEATKHFTAALAINPRAAEVHASQAQSALQRYDVDQARRAIDQARAINAELLPVRQAEADLKMINFDTPGAVAELEQARALNPVDEQTLARLACAYILLDLPQAGPGQTSPRVAKLIDEVVARNPAAGEFFLALGVQLEERRQFGLAIDYLREAARRMPRLVGPEATLGLLQMRLGEEEEARGLLDAAFDADPFNVRVNNMLQVLEVLSTYETLETEHFRVRFDPAKDRLLARYVGERLEKIHPELCATFGFTPPDKSLIEIFNEARDAPGHSWFSARVVGLPYVGTVGACAGKMVALTSPHHDKVHFNWARVLQHEFVHVLNLQQTNYNVPHWFTEALAVWNEGYPRSVEWNRMLARRVPRGEVFTLDNINLGFIRPESSEDWQMAYCQAELYAEYLLRQFGEDAFAKLLAAYARGLATRDALRDCFAIEQEALDAGYREYLEEIVRDLKLPDDAPTRELAELRELSQREPNNAKILGELALALWNSNDRAGARRAAARANKLAPRDTLAAYVLAQAELAEGRRDGAVEILSRALGDDVVDPRATGLLAALELEAKHFSRAAARYEALRAQSPHDPRWAKALAKTALLAGDEPALAAALARLAEIDPDDAPSRKKLAEMAIRGENYEDAVRWARRSLEIDVYDPRTHRILGQALLELGQAEQSVAEYQSSVELAPQDPSLRYALADAWLQAGREAEARGALEALLKIAPDYPGAAEMLENLKP